jgi:4-cresol dehydrogenase (hydroxylating)
LELVLPPSVTLSAFEDALRAFRSIVGEAWVLASEEDRSTYMDPYAIGDGKDHVASAAVAPQSTEEVQAILRIANEHKIPLWPVSRGKNLGYGGAAPLVSGSVVLDLGRMKRIIEVDVKAGFAVIEPGVGFFDLYRHMQANKIPLFMSIPGNGWGSVLGNALERGIGYLPYGNHSSRLCGLEIVLPTGEKLRTGMGAMSNSKTRHLHPYGLGPHWDQLFVQSNFGVVTQAGIWLMPEPEAAIIVSIDLPRFEDLAWFVDEMARLRLAGVVRHPLNIGNYMHSAMGQTQRDQWYKGQGPMPDEVAAKIMRHFKTGWWNAAPMFHGHHEVVEMQAEILRRAIEPRLGKTPQFFPWRRGEPLEGAGAGAPSLASLQLTNWRGGRGGHVDFSPIMPSDGKLALAQARAVRKRFDEFGFDHQASFTLGERYISNINTIVYDRDDRAMTDAARQLFQTLVADAAREGFGEYRTHLSFMQLVADTYDFNDHALMRLNEKVKDALDPNGVLAPGKNGIWPKPFRDRG